MATAKDDEGEVYQDSSEDSASSDDQDQLDFDDDDNDEANPLNLFRNKNAAIG
eukprot:CAMPEP_0170488702 /NCGR_PEP_ID=MMETSP0208-20121228/7183_1 /TAXON_ID=197538 /ORGANISM="Strombidium inclinatum, Strain S3" /LENGTH=52 /DNA_ID=CAMNT_0010763343 /DNA_START=655 /DNA_END=809 /DNA_ORIENTATION=-